MLKRFLTLKSFLTFRSVFYKSSNSFFRRNSKDLLFYNSIYYLSSKQLKSVKKMSDKTSEKTSEKKDNKEKQQKQQKQQKKQRKPRPQPQRNAPILKHFNDGDYGDLIMNQSTYKSDRKWTEITELNKSLDGKEVWVRGRIHSNRGKGKVCFLLLRRGFAKVQASLFTSDTLPREVVKYASKIPPESIIDVYATVVTVKDPILSATQQDIELAVKRIYGVSIVVEPRLPFEIEDASRPESDFIEQKDDEKKYVRVTQKVRLDNRFVDLRTTANHAIFRIQAGVGRFFREYLTNNGFTEFHSPKLIGAASEGGANVFKLDYFGRQAFLAQSPQLYKQMAICGDMRRVFEIGAVFRAEDSNTHRHLCEFTGLDIEMEFNEHYHEVLDVIGDTFIYIFNMLNKHFKLELEAVRKQYPFKDLIYQNKMLILTYKEAEKMLRDYEKKLKEEGKDKEIEELLLGDLSDFSTPAEKKLGDLVKEKYKTEFYCVDKYYMSARPFYTMPDPFDKNLSNSYDLFIRGEEVMSGAQRIHDPKLLTERAKEHKIPLHTIQPYIDSFKYATSPHAGGGVGLERVVMLFLGLDNIRKTSLFPRDPKRCEP